MAATITTFRKLTGPLRALPDFIIIGAQKAGTSSLYHYLAQHPAVAPAIRKEVHYFDWSYGRGLDWYRAHFPTRAYRTLKTAVSSRRLLVGEASPYYLFHPHVPGRVKALLPDVRLIVLLRDPVDRTVSAYQHQMRKGRETLSLRAALERELQQLPVESARLAADPSYNSEFHRHLAYLARGIYADQLPAWCAQFPPAQLLVLHSQDFFADTAAVFSDVVRFLGLPAWVPPTFRKFNAAEYDDLDPTDREWLVRYFAPHNERLYALLGRDFGWPR